MHALHFSKRHLRIRRGEEGEEEEEEETAKKLDDAAVN